MTVLGNLTNLVALKVPGRNTKRDLQPLFDAVPRLKCIADEKNEHRRSDQITDKAFNSLGEEIYVELYWKPERTRLLKGRKF
jgi:hypothetical protein